ncbi:serine hydrolase domain-containing protein [Rhodococcus sp. NPDC059968]|uniref:serine hydrolase domain-containing protein n=1 Tax=Rhodococcus sp. NPDC059968 TaxID=3347017 RepID=UPI00366BDA5F
MTNSSVSNASADTAISTAPENLPCKKEDEYTVADRPHAPDDRQSHRATLANWDEPEHATWGFRHVREIIPTARIARSERPSPLPRRETAEQLPGVEELMGIGNTDALLVLHHGSVVHEEYARGMRPDDTHILMSVSKSIVGTLAGVLVQQGALAPEDDVITYIPEFAGTSFEGASVRDLLDMRAGTRYIEGGPETPAWSAQFGWAPGTPPEPDAITYLARFDNMQEHGGPFAYRSILTDVLGLVLERAGGAPLASLLGNELWGPMGAESDADLMVDRNGFAIAMAGICPTLRDFGRFGHLMLDGSAPDGRQVVPVSWIEDTLRGGPDSAAVFGRDQYEQYFPVPPGGHYRNQWWVPAGGHVVVGLGAHGQQLYVDREAGVVIAMLSTWPKPPAIRPSRIPIFAAFRAIADHLSTSVPRL